MDFDPDIAHRIKSIETILTRDEIVAFADDFQKCIMLTDMVRITALVAITLALFHLGITHHLSVTLFPRIELGFQISIPNIVAISRELIQCEHRCATGVVVVDVV